MRGGKRRWPTPLALPKPPVKKRVGTRNSASRTLPQEKQQQQPLQGGRLSSPAPRPAGTLRSSPPIRLMPRSRPRPASRQTRTRGRARPWRGGLWRGLRGREGHRRGQEVEAGGQVGFRRHMRCGALLLCGLFIHMPSSAPPTLVVSFNLQARVF